MNKKVSLILALLLLSITFSISIFSQRDIIVNCDNNNCLLELAKENNNPKFCETSTNNSKCYYFLALHSNQPDLCEFESDIDKCLQSYAISKGNKEICLEFEEGKKFDCIFSYAINRGDLDACNSIENSSYCIYSYVLYYKDPLLCTLTEKYQSDCNLYFEKNG
jgi:hypothetical protein